MYCKKCELEEVEQGRLDLGYKVCLTCGEAAAREDIAIKRGRVAIAYSKGGYQYITEDTNLGELG